MQRQSLGSPLPKLQHHGGGGGGGILAVGAAAKDDAVLPSPSYHQNDAADDYDNHKARPRRFSLSPRSSSSSTASPPSHEKFVHVIPVLTLLCLLVLFLVSHAPSQSDMAQFSGFRRPSKSNLIIDSSEDDVSGLAELRSGKVLTVRSLRSLPSAAIHGGVKRRSYRRLADF